MIKYLFFTSIVVSIIACGGTKTENKETPEQKQDTAQVKTNSEPEVKYDTMTSEKLIGKWKVIDAMGYSKDSLMVQTFEFTKDEATIYKTYGNGGMGKGSYVVENGELKVSISNKTSDGTTTMTSKFKGGFFEDGKKLMLKSTSAEITLEKK
jgi:hypothetical protein